MLFKNLCNKAEGERGKKKLQGKKLLRATLKSSGEILEFH
jgi:hypothetical protein